MGGIFSTQSPTLHPHLLKTGDLLLISLPKGTSFGLAPPDLVRGLMGAQKGTLATEEEKSFCNTWTLAAMVYRVPSHRVLQVNQPGQKLSTKTRIKQRTDPYVIFANGKGIYLKQVSEFISNISKKGGTIVCRPLQLPHDGHPKNWLAKLDHFYTVISPVGLPWKGGGITLGAQQDPMVTELLEHVLSYVKKMPASTMLTLRKYFIELSTDNAGKFIEGKDLKQLLSKLHDAETSRNLTKKILEAMDLSKDDLISFPEFLAAFSHTPFTHLSEQSDAVGACSAQLICLLYETMNIVPPALPGERSVLPEHFAKHATKTGYRTVELCKGIHLGHHYHVEN